MTSFSSLPVEQQKKWLAHYVEMFDQCPPLQTVTKGDIIISPGHWYNNEKSNITCQKFVHMTAEDVTTNYGMSVDDGIGTFEINYEVIVNGTVIKSDRLMLATYCDNIFAIVCYFPK